MKTPTKPRTSSARAATPTAKAPKKKRADTYHHGDLRRALLDAARNELAKVGLSELSLRSVARRAGVTHTAAYHHFADKNALLMKLAQEGFEKLEASMRTEMAKAPPDAPVELLVAAGRGYIKFAMEDSEAIRLMFEGIRPDEHSDPALKQAGEKAFGTLIEVVVGARAYAGLEGDPVPDALLEWSFVHGYAMLCHRERLNYFGGGNVDPITFGEQLGRRIDEALYSRRR